jgi:hypothetical protein
MKGSDLVCYAALSWHLAYVELLMKAFATDGLLTETRTRVYSRTVSSSVPRGTIATYISELLVTQRNHVCKDTCQIHFKS